MLGPLKSIRYGGDFVIAGFVLAGFVSPYFIVILSGFQMLFIIKGLHYIAGFIIAGCHCIGQMLDQCNIGQLLVIYW